jgi:quinone-modifying oxidoreductase subunit QmoC
MTGPIVYGKMVPTLAVDAVFIPAALFAVFTFFNGVKKYYAGMKASTGLTPRGSWTSALVDVITEFISHKRFDKCDVQKGRVTAHKITFWGFVLLAITTTIALVFEWGTHFGLLHIEAPYLMSNPVKWIGFVGMCLLLFGIFQIFTNRNAKADQAGKGSYFDWLFIGLVAAVGLSGALSWGFRAVLNVAPLAYGTYFIHLVCVFFLFAYAPFSKMAHMVYRTTALVFAKQTGRDN